MLEAAFTPDDIEAMHDVARCLRDNGEDKKELIVKLTNLIGAQREKTCAKRKKLTDELAESNTAKRIKLDVEPELEETNTAKRIKLDVESELSKTTVE